MAISATVATTFGEERACYIRLNNMEASNHGVPTTALFRGFISQEAYATGANYVWEKQIEFTPDLSLPLWSQAYDALCLELGIVNVEV
jgi:hypothetical protein